MVYNHYKKQKGNWFKYVKSLDILSLTFPYKTFPFPMKNFTQLWLKVIKNRVTYSLIQNLFIFLWMLYMFEWTIKEKAKMQHHRTHLLYKWLQLLRQTLLVFCITPVKHSTHLSCKNHTILREKNSLIVNIFCLRLGAATICWWYLSGLWETWVPLNGTFPAAAG